MRERYEDWLDDRLGVLRHQRGRDRDMPAAEAKRARKAAKRRRDAERTECGQRASCDRVAMVTRTTATWRLPARWPWTTWVVALHSTRRYNAAYMRERRRGEVVP